MSPAVKPPAHRCEEGQREQVIVTNPESNAACPSPWQVGLRRKIQRSSHEHVKKNISLWKLIFPPRTKALKEKKIRKKKKERKRERKG